jgi:hypothetical protein
VRQNYGAILHERANVFHQGIEPLELRREVFNLSDFSFEFTGFVGNHLVYGSHDSSSKEPEVEAVQNPDGKKQRSSNQETPQAIGKAGEDVGQPSGKHQESNHPSHTVLLQLLSLYLTPLCSVS